MITTKFLSGSAIAKVLPAFALLGLTACQHQMSGAIDDIYMPQMHYERHPIEVAKGTVKLKIPTRSAALSTKEEDTIIRFAQQARDTTADHVYVQRPAGGMVSSAVAGRAVQILTRYGVPASAIHQTSYKGGAGSPVVISFSRKFAVTDECGDWSDNLTETSQNTSYSNFGCAQQHNLAAMVANPEDLEQPRTMTPPSRARRAVAFEKYIKGEDTASAKSEQAQVKSSEVSQ